MNILEELLRRYQTEIAILRVKMESLLDKIEMLEKSHEADSEKIRRIQSDIEIQMSYMSGIERAIFLTQMMIQEQMKKHEKNGLVY